MMLKRIFRKYLFFGSRQIAAYLTQSKFSAGSDGIQQSMNIIGLQAVYKRLNIRKKYIQYRAYLYRLRKLPITRPNQVWCSDITYTAVKRGFLYVAAIMDWATCRGLTGLL